jgi:GNAT superfamily N-acetyltransferase
MRAPLATQLRETAVPDGAFVRGLRSGDVLALGDLMFAAYAGTIDDEGETIAEQRAEAQRTIAGEHGPVLWQSSLVATDGRDHDGLLGAFLVTEWHGYLLLAFALVVPTWQGRGLGTALITRSANRCRTAGCHEWTLAVTRGNAAIDLYGRLGFVEDQSLH